MSRISSSHPLLNENQPSVPLLTISQSRLDASFSSFSSQSIETSSIAVMTITGLTGHLTRCGILGFFGSKIPLPNLVSHLGSVAAEAMTSTLLQEGHFFSHFVNFGVLRLLGIMGKTQHNPPLQHLIQSAGMVAGHQVTTALGLEENSNESIAQQFMNASVTQLQIRVGNLLASKISGYRLQSLERNLEHQTSILVSAGSNLALSSPLPIALHAADPLHRQDPRVARKARSQSSGPPQIWEYSPTLQSLTPAQLQDPLTFARNIRNRLPEIKRELATALENDQCTYVQIAEALVRGNKIAPSRRQSFLRTAAAMGLYERQALIQEIGKHFRAVWGKPRHAISLFDHIERVRDEILKTSRHYSLQSILEALIVGDETFPSNHAEQYARWMNAREYISTHPEMKNLPGRLAHQSQEFIFWDLIRLKTRLCQRGENIHLGQIMAGLAMHRVRYTNLHGMDVPIEMTMVAYATSLNQVYEKWDLWQDHFRELRDLPDHMKQAGDTTRAQYAREHLRLCPQDPTLSDVTLYKWTRMGLLLLDYRERTGESILSTSHTQHREGPIVIQRLRTFLESRRKQFENEAPERQLVLTLVQLRREFLSDFYHLEDLTLPGEVEKIGLETLGNMIHKITGKHKVLGAYGSRFDNTVLKWPSIAPHVTQIVGTRNPTQRVDLLESILRTEDGQRYTRASVRFFYPWIRLIFEHRAKLGLQASESYPDPNLQSDSRH